MKEDFCGECEEYVRMESIAMGTVVNDDGKEVVIELFECPTCGSRFEVERPEIDIADWNK